uniref:2,3-bisphosphoglycerate 3-phosphatase n=1 Tax=Neogobius melanostomus TaxID=47308 RepID=A0A8C6U2W5_9GOBI
ECGPSALLRYEDVVSPSLNSPPQPRLRAAGRSTSTAVIRHGTRFPTVKNVKRMRRLSELVYSSGRSGTRTTWTVTIKYFTWTTWTLVEKGREDLMNLAVRLAASFPALLSEAELRSGRIGVKTSSKHRCVSSAQAFQDGLRRGQGRSQDEEYIHEVDDSLMRSFERCRGYVEGVETNASATAEVDRFKHGPEFRAVRDRLSERLGLTRICSHLVEAAFFICSYELAIKSDAQVKLKLLFVYIQVLEYKCDLKQFWKRAHGHSINGLSSCPLFHHIFRTLDRAGPTDAPPEPASILIGHAETLLPLISLLGLYKDKTPPTAVTTNHTRLFRSSSIVPYASNLLFVLYDCPRGPRLQLLMNESPVRFPGLSQDLPLYRDVRATYRHLLDGCDFYTECEGRPSRAPNTEL